MQKIVQFLTGIFILPSIISCTSGRPAREQENNKIEMVKDTAGAIQQILDSAGVSGSVLIYDPQKGTYYSNDFERCNIGHLPASTFKIANSIIALETGVIEDDSTLIKWDGQKRRLPVWEQDLTFRDAFQYSCVPCYQEIAREIGADRMNTWLEKLDYGYMQIDSNNIDLFWLEGDSRINQVEQVNFLSRFYYSVLPISDRTVEIMKRLMIIEDNGAYRLSGKTGWSVRNGNNNGWFVGYLEKDNAVFFIATNIDPNVDFNIELFNVIRKEISMKAFSVLGLVD